MAYYDNEIITWTPPILLDYFNIGFNKEYLYSGLLDQPLIIPACGYKSPKASEMNKIFLWHGNLRLTMTS